MKSVGIIGGLGPETTVEFYTNLVQSSECREADSRPSIFIASVPISYELQERVILDGAPEGALPLLVNAAKSLERAGADFLVMPCCSFHVFIEQLRRAVKIPVLSIVEEAAGFFRNLPGEKVAVLGTKSTIDSQLFTNALTKYGIIEEIPESLEQEGLCRHISQLALSGASPESTLFVTNLIEVLHDRGASHTLLACTDLQLAISDKLQNSVLVDSLDLLLKAVKREVFGK